MWVVTLKNNKTVSFFYESDAKKFAHLNGGKADYLGF